MRIAFKNLIENGIKYSSDKNIYIKSYNENPFKITVCNNCRPMPEKLKNHLLEPFIKYNYEDLQLVSSGLGLFICKELLSKNKAEITYSIVEDNICFSIEFMNYQC
ncbi:ATP-binding protein [Alkaliphilus sp. B6464]|uniref:ATP-binding protein n=1 Tax=Alkaliphilus sp. B6464 TaxID=2731219 RepID=UPI001BA8929A|nr:sensor histidine kinase [Alkaliphilus sp. B6464]